MLTREGYQGPVNAVQGAKEQAPGRFIFGDRVACKEVMDPQSPLAFFLIGDSRLFNISTDILSANCARMPLAGSAIGFIGAGNAFNTQALYNPAGTVPVNTPYGWLGQLTPWTLYEWTLTGAASGANDQLAQYCYGGFASGMYSRRQLQGSTCTVTFVLLASPDGIATNDLEPVVEYGGNTYRGAYFNLYSANQVYKVVTVTIPNDHDWTTNHTVYAKIVHRRNTATVAGKKVVLLGSWIAAARGTYTLNLSVGSRNTLHFLDPRIFSPTLLQNFFGANTPNAAFLYDLGTNGPAFAADAAAKKQLVDISRAAYPGAPVLFASAYRGAALYAGPSISTDQREANIAAVVANPVKTAMVDTEFYLPGPAQAVSGDGLSAPYFTNPDYTHYNPVGFAAYARALSDIMASARSACSGGAY